MLIGYDKSKSLVVVNNPPPEKKPEQSKSLIPIVSDLLGHHQEESTTTFKIVPDFNISNSNNISIVHAIANLYQPPKQRLNITEGSFLPARQSYFDILFQPKKADFFITTYKQTSNLIENKMKTSWSKAEIREVEDDELKSFDLKYTEIFELMLRDFNFKSLLTNRNDLYPLTNMMGVTSQLQKNEKVRVNIAIEPIKRSNWIKVAKDEYDSYRDGKVINNETSNSEKLTKLGFQGAEALLNLYIQLKMLPFESIFGIFIPDKKEDNNKVKLELTIDSIEDVKKINQLTRLTDSTTYKMTSEAFKVKISILSQSNDKNRAKLNMLSVVNSYKDLTDDNELCVKLLNKNEQEELYNQIMRNSVSINKKCILSDKEVAKLIQLPQRELQREYKVESIENIEVDIPKELQNGQVRIGIVNKQGKKTTATWSQDKNIMALAKLFVGAQNSGKTTALKRTAKDCHKAGYSNIVIDFIESCETARDVAEVIPENEKVIIKLGTKDMIPALAYNEVSKLITEDMDSWERVRLANLIAEQVEYLINAITDASTGELTAPMLRYLHSACMVTFIKPNAKIADVFDILRRWDKRNEAIRYAKYSKCFDEDDDIFFDLNELHQRNQEGKIIGTKENLIIGILNRITVLQKNPYLKAMLKADIDMEQDFAKYVEQGKSIFIMIPQNLFPNAMIRDILTTFFISRIWLTVQMRENNKDSRLCNVIFDEVHQVPTTARFLSNHVTEFRRHRLGLMLSCHFLGQLGHLLNSLKSSGVSYVLIAGTEKENLEKLKEELKPFTVEDGLALKKHTSLNIVNYGNQYAKFIAELPAK